MPRGPNPDELFELKRTDDRYKQDDTQSGTPHKLVRTQKFEKRVHWADSMASFTSEREGEQVGPWDETAKRMIAAAYFVMYCTLPGPGSHMTLLEDLTKDK